ncbi:MAG: glutamine--tRNA ligase/YqeY domain fusion protein, partial [Bacteroidota bacterium]
MSHTEEKPSTHFIEDIILDDLASGKHTSIQTRFPPEPNGYLHIGHVKAICLVFGLAEKYKGKCNLRFDDTNPVAEDPHFIESIQNDIKWLGFEWDKLLFASDYFEQLYDWAVQLINQGDAYVDESTAKEISDMRGVPTRPGENSPFRDRPAAESLDLLARMRAGEFEEGSYVVRAKIDMASPNMHLRDPIMYRILKHPHHRTGSDWAIYPTYDYAHGQSDSIEKITHSLCTLEFVVHRPLYEWFIEKLGIFPSRQIEFSRLEVNHIMMSKRYLKRLVNEGHVDGWDDPRMPTIAGFRRAGYPPEALRNFATAVGVTTQKSTIDFSLLEYHVREVLNKTAPRVMVVLDPLKVVVTNWPEDKVEHMEVDNLPGNPDGGSRTMPFSRELWIERADFMEDPPKKYFRLAPGKEVRFKGAFIIRCDEAVKNEAGEVVELRCTYDPDTRSGSDTSGKKVKGTIHWVSASHAKDVEVRLYDRLFSVEDPKAQAEAEGGDYTDFLNPESLVVLPAAKAEPSLADAEPGTRVQFMRKGYFVKDITSTADKLV